MRMSEGIWYCTKCGRRGKELREQCDGPSDGTESQDPAQGGPGEGIECGQCAESAQADCKQSHSGDDVLQQGPFGGHIVVEGPEQDKQSCPDTEPGHAAKKGENESGLQRTQ